MTVKELIEKLQKMPKGLEVVIENENVDYIEDVKIREPDIYIEKKTVVII